MKKIKLHYLFFTVALACVLRAIWSDGEFIPRWAITGIVVGIVGAFIDLQET